MPYQTMKENLKLQLSPGLVTAYDIKPGNGVGLFWDTKHIHIYLLTYFPLTHTGKISKKTSIRTSTDSCQIWPDCHHSTCFYRALTVELKNQNQQRLEASTSQNCHCL